MILAIDHHIPFVALSYGEKTNSLIKDLSWKYSYTPKAITVEDITHAIVEIES